MAQHIDPRYATDAWKKLSLKIRVRDGRCVLCWQRFGKPTVKPAHTDHIVPVSKGGNFWDESNLQALCIPCHNWKTGRDDRGEPYNPRCARKGLPIPYCKEKNLCTCGDDNGQNDKRSKTSN